MYCTSPRARNPVMARTEWVKSYIREKVRLCWQIIATPQNENQM